MANDFDIRRESTEVNLSHFEEVTVPVAPQFPSVTNGRDGVSLSSAPASDRQTSLLAPRVAEFFAGIGLVRQALERVGFRIVFANDIEPIKRNLYVANFGEEHFECDDIRNVIIDKIPSVELATASFPCTDLSLAGNRRGLDGKQSSMFWEFAHKIEDMGSRKPPVILLENVPSFATSRGGKDLESALVELNRLGYLCDLIILDARMFVPQSRPRLFIIGSQSPLSTQASWDPSEIRPAWVQRFVVNHPKLKLQALPLEPPAPKKTSLADVVERLVPEHALWWQGERLERFVASLVPRQKDRLEAMKARPLLSWSTAYRRTRAGAPVWEIRADSISGCLRTARGGSSKQALVEAGLGQVRVRWMTAREYARLQGTPNYIIGQNVTESQALFGFGDAVCVPAVEWVARVYLRPLLEGKLTQDSRKDVECGRSE